MDAREEWEYHREVADEIRESREARAVDWEAMEVHPMTTYKHIASAFADMARETGESMYRHAADVAIVLEAIEAGRVQRDDLDLCLALAEEWRGSR